MSFKLKSVFISTGRDSDKPERKNILILSGCCCLGTLRDHKTFYMVHTDLRPFFSSTFQGLFKDKSHFFKDSFSTQFDIHVINPSIQMTFCRTCWSTSFHSRFLISTRTCWSTRPWTKPKRWVSLAVHIDCFACASRFLSAVSARSRPNLRCQLSSHTIDRMLFACLLLMHSLSLCIEGHVPLLIV